MKTMTKKAQAEAEKVEAANRLRELFPPGSTCYTILRHVSRSGMFRRISLVAMTKDGPHEVDYLAAKVLGEKIHKDGGIGTGGCGMDMGFHLVSNMSRALYPEGFGCIGRTDDRSVWCPSNDHSNGDRDYTPHPSVAPESSLAHWHKSGDYAIRHRWL